MQPSGHGNARAIGAFPAAPKVPSTPLDSLSPGPISYFQQSCARCHGPMGTMFADSFAATGEVKLSEDVRRMVTGPGQSTLSSEAMTGLVAFHRSLAKSEPFIIVTRIESVDAEETIIEGEASTGGEVTLVVHGEEFHAQIEQWRWRATLPARVSQLQGATARVAIGAAKAACNMKIGESSHDATLPRE